VQTLQDQRCAQILLPEPCWNSALFTRSADNQRLWLMRDY
jgi:hypothetical protein